MCPLFAGGGKVTLHAGPGCDTPPRRALSRQSGAHRDCLPAFRDVERAMQALENISPSSIVKQEDGKGRRVTVHEAAVEPAEEIGSADGRILVEPHHSLSLEVRNI